MSKKIVTTNRMIIENPHAVYISHGSYDKVDMFDYGRARSYLYRTASGTVGFSSMINGSSNIYSYVFFENEEDMLVFMLKLQGRAKKAHMWKTPDGYTFYKVEETQHS